MKTTLAALGLIVVALYGVGCGSGSSSQNVAAPGSFTINVTAASGGAPAGKTVGLVVNIIR